MPPNMHTPPLYQQIARLLASGDYVSARALVWDRLTPDVTLLPSSHALYLRLQVSINPDNRIAWRTYQAAVAPSLTDYFDLRVKVANGSDDESCRIETWLSEALRT